MKAEVEFQKKFCQEVETVEQKRPADIFQELLDYLWNGLGLEEKGWKRLKKGDFKKKTKNGLTYQIWFDRSRYNYIDYEIGHGNVEVGFSCIIKQGDDYLYSFRIEPTTGGSFFRMLTEDLRLNTGLLDTFLPLVKANYLDFIDRFEADPVEALQPVCAPFTEAEDYSWRIHVDKQMVERYGTAGGVPPPGGIAQNAGVQGEDPYRKVVILPVPCQGCGSCLGLKPHQRGTGPGGGTLCAGQAADRTVDAGG